MTEQTQEQKFDHLDRMQKRIMTAESFVTKEEFLKAPIDEQNRYYQWMRRQCGELCDLI